MRLGGFGLTSTRRPRPRETSLFDEAQFFGSSGGTPLGRLVTCGPRTGQGYFETLTGQRTISLPVRTSLFSARIVTAVWVPTPAAPLVCGAQLWVFHEDGELWRYSELGCVLERCKLFPSTTEAEAAPEGVRAAAVQLDHDTYRLVWVSTQNRLWTGHLGVSVSDRSLRCCSGPAVGTGENILESAVLTPVTTLPSALARAASLDLCWLADSATVSVCSNAGDWCLVSLEAAAPTGRRQTTTMVLHGIRSRRASVHPEWQSVLTGSKSGFVSSDGRYCVWLTRKPWRLLVLDSLATTDDFRSYWYRLPLPKEDWLVERQDGLWVPSTRRQPKQSRRIFMHIALLRRPNTETVHWYWSLVSIPDGVAQSMAVYEMKIPTGTDLGSLVCIAEDDGCTLLWIQSGVFRVVARLQSTMPCQQPLVDWGLRAPGVLLYEAFARSKMDSKRSESDRASLVDDPANRILMLTDLQQRGLLLDAAEQCIVWAFHTLTLDQERQSDLLETARWALTSASWHAWRWLPPRDDGQRDALTHDSKEEREGGGTSARRLASLLHWWHQVAMWLRFRNLLAPLTPVSAFQLQQPGALRCIMGRLVRYAAVIALQRDQEHLSEASLVSLTGGRIGSMLGLLEQGMLLSKAVSRDEIATAFATALLHYAAAQSRNGCLQRAEYWIRALFLPASLTGEKRSTEQQAMSERMAPFLCYASLNATALATSQERLAYELALAEPNPSARIRALCRLPETSAPAQALQVFIGFYPRISNEDLLIILDRYLEENLGLQGLADALRAHPLIQNAILSELDQRGDASAHAILRRALRRVSPEKAALPFSARATLWRSPRSPTGATWFSKVAHLLDWNDTKYETWESETDLTHWIASVRAELGQTMRATDTGTSIEQCLSDDWVEQPAKLLLATLYLDMVHSFKTSQKGSRSKVVAKWLALNPHWVQRVALALVAQCALDHAHCSKNVTAELDRLTFWLDSLMALAALSIATTSTSAGSMSAASAVPTSTSGSAIQALGRHHRGLRRGAQPEKHRNDLPLPFPVAATFSDWDRQVVLDTCLAILSLQDPGIEREKLRECTRDVLLRLEDEVLRQTYEERWQRLSTPEVVRPRPMPAA
ncbi:hypothetical protein F1559_002438 [Cyanidiococcus yangmingshanensis]|uniref:Uncharacterized protein n=1 Tax=Cyanidiococcus yangmingshanensis TaxID=2690220 RepID=A0A7J7IEJ4_9RHOD|nr:hypothetical protein F1559_002438 [Cyanidiococcus yangmingshanensis]